MFELGRLSWLEQKKIAAWTRCRRAGDSDPGDWRLDDFGNLVYRADHGKQTEYGWEVDHIVALAAGGLDTLENVRALHWRKNRQLGGILGALLDEESAFNHFNPNTLGGLFGSGRRR